MTTTVALTGASVLTCDRDGTVLADHTVLVDEPGARAGDRGFWKTPLGSPMLRERARGFADVELNSGVTTLRGLGEYDNEAVVLGRESESGQWLGPRIMASGPLLAITGGHGAELGVARIVLPGRDARRCVRTCVWGLRPSRLPRPAGSPMRRSSGRPGVRR